MRNLSQWVYSIGGAVCAATVLVGCGLMSVSDQLGTPVTVQWSRSRKQRGDRRAQLEGRGHEPAGTYSGVPGASL